MATDDNLSLEDWNEAQRKTIKSTRNPLAARLLECIENGEVITITYDGGINPGSTREILPKNLFRVEGMGRKMYLDAHCYARNDSRCFRLDRLELTHEHPAKPKKRISKIREASDRGRFRTLF